MSPPSPLPYARALLGTQSERTRGFAVEASVDPEQHLSITSVLRIGENRYTDIGPLLLVFPLTFHQNFWFSH